MGLDHSDVTAEQWALVGRRQIEDAKVIGISEQEDGIYMTLFFAPPSEEAVLNGDVDIRVPKEE